MDFFQDNYKPLQIRVKSRDEVNEKGVVIKEGKEHIICTKPLTPKVVKTMTEIRENTEKDPEKFGADGIYQTLELLIDKPREFWNDFSLVFLTDLIKYVSAKANEKKN